MNLVFKILFLMCFSLHIPAQDFESSGRDSIFTDEITVETNRIIMTKILSPNKIQVLDERAILSFNGSRLSDALEMSDAVFIKDYGFNSGSKIISLNSTQSEHTLILLNGIRLNSRQNAQVDLSLYDLDNVSQIEVSKGGSSALYGSEAIGGVINIITKKFNSSNSIGFNFKTSIGSYGLRKFFGKFSHSFDFNLERNITYNISYSDERANNNFKYNFKNGPNEILRERKNSDFNAQAFNFDITYIPEDESVFKLFTIYTHFERGAPGIDLGYSQGTARQVDDNYIAGLNYGNEISDAVHINHSINYKYQLQKYFDPSTFNLSVKIDSYYKLNNLMSSSVLSYIPSERFSMESGAELSFDDILSNETEKGSLVNASFFTSAKYVVNTKPVSEITFYPSVRYDYFSNIQQKNVVTGKLGINIKPFVYSDFSIKSSIGNNFSAPTFNELYWKDLGNKNLKPEHSISLDAGLFCKFKLLAVNEIEFSYYNINTTDRIVWTPVSGSIWRPVNVGKVKSEGIDVSLKSGILINKKFNVSFNINYVYGSSIKKNVDFQGDPSYNKQLIYLPKEMVKAAFMFNYLTTSKLLKLVSFNLFYKYTTRRYVNFENTVFEPRYDILDANIGFGIKAFNGEVNCKFIVNNVLNENYEVVSGYPMPLRNYKFEIGFKY